MQSRGLLWDIPEGMPSPSAFPDPLAFTQRGSQSPIPQVGRIGFPRAWDSIQLHFQGEPELLVSGVQYSIPPF